MISKGERTRRRIVEKAAGVFNTKGYFGSSMNDLVREVGLEKGGIYNHFASKEELALEAFDYAAGTMRERFRVALEGKEGALERLFAVVDVLGGLAEDPPVAGGCPILNTAVESDDAHLELKGRAREAMSGWLRLIGGTVKEGVRTGELWPGTDPRKTASVVVATLEGAVMLSRLYDDPAYMKSSVDHLKQHLGSLARGPERSGA
ncbi:MAG: Transcriptional regulator, AcrR family [uncultured Rubrobacteraceae bacterium]|uniref:Transcriptional regulator, AcrR family n=1 Tax=uncultured Rubrobacteraceae bacterium TaxID=349277 RepID=A0A6J4PMS9_9ACTN|nr:MAG: Transcriptional regulator, AcrR family [uncultured Rubrobacteraceae bacterium]